tara:strand:+ start:7829 stop:8497 length:669 start_codon:yes stop_codon:yes gene_type:complete
MVSRIARFLYSIFKLRGKPILTMARTVPPPFSHGASLHRAAQPLCLALTRVKARMHGKEGHNTMTIKQGEKLPDVTLTKTTPDGPEKVQSADYFAGKKVALFSVPGAFTPTCSAKHLPGFVEKADELKSKGVDEIACTAVNDPFVMQAWCDRDGSEAITMLADGNGDFAEALGLTMDGSGFGLGKRGQRWSMVVDDGTVTELNVEDPGAFEKSTAEYMLDQL